MPIRRLGYGAAIVAVTMLAFGNVLPARAFYLEVPEAFKQLVEKFQSATAKAQESPMPGPGAMFAPGGDAPRPTPIPGPGPMQNPSPVPMLVNQMPTANQAQPMDQMNRPPQQDVYMPQGPCQNGDPNCSGWNQGGQVDGQMPPNNMGGMDKGFQPGDQGMGQNIGQMGPGGMQNGGPNPNDMKREASRMERQLKNMESLMKKSEKQGVAVPPEMKEKYQKSMEMIKLLKENPDSAQNIDMGELNNDIQEMEQSRGDMERMAQMKRDIKNMENPIKMFEKQIAKLEKQGIAAPTSITEPLSQLKAFVQKVKDAKSAEEIGDMSEVGDLMGQLDESRRDMEMLSRWPQALKEANKQITRLEKELKKSKTIVDRLAKKGIDLTSAYQSFDDAVNKIKAVRDDAAAKVKDGSAEEAFDLLENEIFGQMEDIWEHSKIIQTMSNLGRFQSEFKRGLTDGQRMLKSLKRKVSAEQYSLLEEQFGELKAKGEEIIAVIKAGNTDPEEIMTSLQELENTGQEFQNTMDEFLGVKNEMGWEKGPAQSMAPDMSQNLSKILGKKFETMRMEQQPGPLPQQQVMSEPTLAPGTSGGSAAPTTVVTPAPATAVSPTNVVQ